MKLTINLDEKLFEEVEAVTNQTGQTVTAVIEDALRQMLNQRKPTLRPDPIRLITVSGNGLLSGVNLDKSASLLDCMESNT